MPTSQTLQPLTLQLHAVHKQRGERQRNSIHRRIRFGQDAPALADDDGVTIADAEAGRHVRRHVAVPLLIPVHGQSKLVKFAICSLCLAEELILCKVHEGMPHTIVSNATP